MEKTKQFWDMVGNEVSPKKARMLYNLVREWAEAIGNPLRYEKPRCDVSLGDLMMLALMVEQATRERCAKMVEGEPFMDGRHHARGGPRGVGTWHESSSLHRAMQALAWSIREA